MVHSYFIAGLSVDSEIPLPGIIVARTDEGPAQVAIRRGLVGSNLEHADLTGSTWAMAKDQFLLRVPGIARFLLIEGREVRFEMEGGAELEDAGIFLLGTVFGILLHQRQQIVLHASAVQVNGTAVLFCGRSGMGKSTLAAALGQRGYPLVTDDICTVIIDSEKRAIVHPGGRQLKLWQQAIEKLDLAASRGEHVRNRIEKFYVEPISAICEPLPLGAIYTLNEVRPPYVAGIERPNIVDAAHILRRSAYRPSLVRRMGQGAHYFQSAAEIAEKAGIFYLRRPFDFAEMPATISLLVHHWSEIGLSTEQAA